MEYKISQLIQVMEEIAPPALSESWDNVGLHIGSPEWPVRSVWVALDPLSQIVDAACKNKVDLLITHHPLFIKSLDSIDFNTSLGKIIQQCAESRLSIYCAHTNLDSANGGVNDVLADAIGLTNLVTLVEADSSDHSEINGGTGLGRIGELVQAMNLEDLALSIKNKLGVDRVLFSGDPGLLVKKAAVCSGSGASLVGRFLASDADVYISGDLKYHNARDVESAGRGLIDISHFASEHLVLESLVDRIRKRLTHDSAGIDIQACELESEPFKII